MPPKKREAGAEVDGPRKKKGKKGDSSNGSSGARPGGSSIDNDLEDEAEAQIVHAGSQTSGSVLTCGGTNWDLIGRKCLPKGVKSTGGRNLWGPHIMTALSGVRVRTVMSGCTACHTILITDEGKAMSWGRNDKGQLGHGDCLRKDNPTLIESLSAVTMVDAACGRNHTLILSDKGHVYAIGDNKMGQLGVGHQNPLVTCAARLQYKGPPIKKVACGAEFSMVSDVRGNLYSMGCPEFGQLGHNSDGKYFVTSTKLSYASEVRPRRIQAFIEKNRDGSVVPINDVEVIDLACGTNHSIIIDTKKRAFTWGFGGYGRLGHSEPKDEWVPRLVKAFDGPNRGAIRCTAGSSFSMAVSELGALFLWGQNKPTGEAAMYPKPIQDLSGWQIRSLSCCNRSIVIAADETVIAWGPSPTYGELGYGDNKPRSSTTPQEVKSLSGMHIHEVACGFGHTVMIARDDSEEDKAKLAKLPDFTPTPCPVPGP